MPLLSAAVLAGLISSSAVAAPPNIDPALHEKALDLMKKGLAFRTVIPGNQVPVYAAYLKDVLVQSGFKPDEVTISPVAGSATLTARYPGTDPKKKPILIIDHMDVVEAKPADWTRDPFTPVVEKGYIFGRGAVDDKFDVSIVVTVLGQLKKEGWKPGRDVILALSGDEETLMQTARKLAQDLKGVELVLNGDGGGGLISEDGKPVLYEVQGAEKTYADFSIEVTDSGGHSSRPGKTNAIYELSQDLGRLAAYRFPAMRSELTDTFFKATAANTPGPAGEAIRRYVADPSDPVAIETLSADRDFVGQLRTTCVTTMIEGGHAPNALPQKATANVNCRIFPGTSAQQVRQTLQDAIGDSDVHVAIREVPDAASPPPPLDPKVLGPAEKLATETWPGTPQLRLMSAGATDGAFLTPAGIPTYGISGDFGDPDGDGVHGLNERVRVKVVYDSRDYLYRLMKIYGDQKD